MQKKIAILQSNYIPWKGYFDIINMVDMFIFHDDLQYTKGDWRNRNKIKTDKGTEWLTIPCGTSEKRLICEVTLNDSLWQKQHWNKIQLFYKKSPYFSFYKSFFEEIYLNRKWTNLSELNQHMIIKISREIFNIKTVFEDSRNFGLKKRKAERVLELLKKAKATHYLRGPSAQNYFDSDFLLKHGISIEWMDYNGYPEYNQLYPPFEHHVSILDLIFNEGENAVNFMKSFR